jgi:acyl carrier protein
MGKPEILAGLQEVFDQVFLSPVTVTEKLSAKDVAEWDSLLHISHLLMVEKRFSIRFRVGEVEATRNVGEFADLILKRLAAG